LRRSEDLAAELNDPKRRIEALYRTYASRVLDFARNRGSSLDEAEDVVSEVFLVCWRRPEEIPDEPLGWLLGVARRVLANQRRSKGRKAALRHRMAKDVLPSSDSEEWAGSFDTRAQLRAALVNLRDEDREVLLLVGWDGLAYREAASVLGCSPRAFALRLHRARARLMKQMGPMWTFGGAEGIANEGEGP